MDALPLRRRITYPLLSQSKKPCTRKGNPANAMPCDMMRACAILEMGVPDSLGQEENKTKAPLKFLSFNPARRRSTKRRKKA